MAPLAPRHHIRPAARSFGPRLALQLTFMVATVLALNLPAPATAAPRQADVTTTVAGDGAAPTMTAVLADAVAAQEEAVVAQEPGSGPQPVGRPLPVKSQRIADTAILVGLLAVLFGGPALWVWLGRRRREDPAPDGTGELMT
jgi:hypothetical protein